MHSLHNPFQYFCEKNSKLGEHSKQDKTLFTTSGPTFQQLTLLTFTTSFRCDLSILPNLSCMALKQKFKIYFPFSETEKSLWGFEAVDFWLKTQFPIVLRSF
jgi:hypothetical protein